MNMFGRAVGPALAAMLVAAPALAQDMRDLDDTTGDVRVFKGELAGEPATYTLTMPADTALMIDASPAAGSQIDPYVRVRDAASGEILAENDDGGGDLGARAFVFAEGERRIEIEVSAQGAVETECESGAFELALRPTDWRPTPPRQIDFGDRVTGTLKSGEQHVFHIRAAQGQVLTAALRADEDGTLDPYLELRRGASAGGAMLVEDDDGGGSLNARLRYAARDSGVYTLIVRDYGSGAGDYVLEIGSGSDVVDLPAPQEISLDHPQSGELVSGTGLAGENGPQAHYRLSEAAKDALRTGPQLLVVRLRAMADDSDFDPVLDVAFETPLGLAVIASDDDGGENLDAELSLDLSPLGEEPDWLGRLRFVARSFGETGGLYTIEVATAGELAVAGGSR